MSLLLNYCALLFLLLWLQQHPCLVLGISKQEKHRFIERCPPSSCGSLEIGFPLRLRNSPATCGLVDLDLACQGNATFLSLPSSSSPFRVTAIDYRNGLLTVDLGSSPPCPLRNLSFLSSPTYMPAYDDYYDFGIGLLSCSKEIQTPGNDWSRNQVAGPISCLSSRNRVGYAINLRTDLNSAPPECKMTSVSYYNNSNFPFSFIFPKEPNGRFYGRPSLKELVEDITERRQAKLWWSFPDYSTENCADCELRGKTCGFSWERNVSFCFKKNLSHRSTVMIIAGTSTAGALVLLSVLVVLLYVYRKSEKERETRLKVERFLATYKATKPKRYTFSELKKMTKQLRHKLGQGGFGSVYKGELPNGVPVAIKMLETSKGEGDEFINEVATIGKIHHVNVVRLLGFCSEGTRHALIYEFMPNGSLEKFIFLEDAKSRRGGFEPLTMEKLLEIAIDIARGIEYLHQGCDQRILHFDIKPHNILLDYNFSPKISDFGLAKLCSRDHSIVTMTAARGTMGYIAPEMYSRNFGTVSYKSDVYSFGMLLMEMVSGRKNVDPVIENLQLQKMEESDVYFPEWAYDRLITGADIGLSTMRGKKATDDTDEEIVKKLLIVAFWCIQWNPTDRPTMTRVIQLLMEDLESLQIPPKPFISPNQQDNDSSSSTTNQV
ncbi:rust resistance kinase Lr10-like isoform X1 [Iris pallida]|uniref:Rust resistance kinase Lr10-like isoform X1 n=1 Tax=Iris pallida TaxID=29817 RepID=A0AAX6DM15_IRIPA|nr:rust resistance kinase Lr10-like isoform X1 [Iris pallida]